MSKILPWREALADYFRQHSFSDFDTREQSVAEKSVEFYQKEINEKSNERSGVSAVRENPGGGTTTKKQDPEG